MVYRLFRRNSYWVKFVFLKIFVLLLRLCGKCIVGQSSAKFDKVDMFSKQAIKKQSWQSWCIFLSIFKNIMQSKVGKVEMWIHYSRQSWQSSDFYISNNGQSSYPRQSWQSWKYFWANLASLYNWQSWQSSNPRQS